ncbi:hypothetical protein EB235_05070 [Mesorhizobium loti R88b]|uniref:Uncharacterized protein n=1 Tax=Mesorhizobium loti R88b TaxID=935548 RepID=A0A6M7WJJ0_RHILI|nr:hypothetical protein EB235_05070 [Mesorhizobium loti R88b]
MTKARWFMANHQRWRSADDPLFVILGRSKERSDAAQTLGSMPRPSSCAAVGIGDAQPGSITYSSLSGQRWPPPFPRSSGG